MANIIAATTMSVDGYITGPDGAAGAQVFEKPRTEPPRGGRS